MKKKKALCNFEEIFILGCGYIEQLPDDVTPSCRLPNTMTPSSSSTASQWQPRQLPKQVRPTFYQRNVLCWHGGGGPKITVLLHTVFGFIRNPSPNTRSYWAVVLFSA